jgi:amidase
MDRRTSSRFLLILLLLSGSASLAAAQNPQASGFRLQEATIADIHAAFAAGTLTCRQLVGLYLDRIHAYGTMARGSMRSRR